MPSLFESTNIGSLRLSNRFIRSATWMAMAEPDGSCTSRLIECCKELADGEIGLIISGFAFVSREGQGPPGMAGLHTDAVAETFGELVAAVHARGGRIAAQIAHCGIRSSARCNEGLEILGPSEGLTREGEIGGRALLIPEIDRIVSDFAAAARRAQQVGFDAVQLHFAHGYLGSQFLSPYYNRRSDEYGGSFENRFRFLKEVYKAVRLAVGREYPVMAKLNSEDFIEGGLSLDDGVRAALELERLGLDMIEVSGGTADSGQLGPSRALKCKEDELYLLENARRIRDAIAIPVAAVGGIRRFEDAVRLVEVERIDYVSLSRPFIREPHLIRRWKGGDRSVARCESCRRCFRTHLEGRGTFCAKDVSSS